MPAGWPEKRCVFRLGKSADAMCQPVFGSLHHCARTLGRGYGFELLECSVAPGGDEPVTIQKKQRVDHPGSGSRPWLLVDPGLLELANKIQQRHPTLGSLSSRISAGIATGRDRIFVLKHGAGEELEPELRRPAVRGKDISPYRIQDYGLEVIIPYLATPHGRPTLADLDDYPRTKVYLERFRTRIVLQNRARNRSERKVSSHSRARDRSGGKVSSLIRAGHRSGSDLRSPSRLRNRSGSGIDSPP